MRNRIRKAVAVLMFCLTTALAPWAFAAPVQGDQARPMLVAASEHESLWDRTKQNAAKTWRETKHGAKKAWEGTKDVTSEAYHGAKKTVSKGVDTIKEKTK